MVRMAKSRADKPSEPESPEEPVLAPESGSENIPGTTISEPIEVRRGRTSVVMGLLGIPTVGLTAIAGIGLGLAGIRSPRPAWSIAGTLFSLIVLAGWIGGLAGFLNTMNALTADPPPAGIIHGGGKLGTAMAAQIARGVDRDDPQTPPDSVLAEILERMPASLRRHVGNPPGGLAIETLPRPPGCLLRWRIGPPLDPAMGSAITPVDPERGGIYLYAADGRMLVGLDGALLSNPHGVRLDDDDVALIARLVPHARKITTHASDRNGQLPNGIEGAEILQSGGTGGVPTPRYRRRPGGLFDLIEPDSGRRITFAAFGGVLLPLQP
jgi:hypothetical protein